MNNRHNNGRLTNFRELISTQSVELFSQFREGVSIEELLLKRTEFIDEILTSCWQEFIDDDDEAALIAVGGYGRMELHPGSDIDILILIEPEARERMQKNFVDFFTFLWDIGLKPGQSVRTLNECEEIAATDITVITNLTEARPLCGNLDLFQKLNERINPTRMWNTQQFFEAKIEEQENRHRKYNDTAFNLEPNIKEGPGGLRDIQTLAWVTQRHFDTRSFWELVKRGYLIETEFAELTEAQHFLWRVRFALHMQTGRSEERLLFDYQKQLADLLGYKDNSTDLAVEQLMQQYYRAVIKIQRLNEMLLQLFREALLETGSEPQFKSINSRFQSRNDYLETVDNCVFVRTPPALLETFLLMQKHPELKGVRAATIRLIRENLHLIDDSFRNDAVNQRLFMDILRQPDGITHQFRRMNRYGVLAAYMPDFAHIVGRMQYDLFHVYTVDEHTLFLIRNLRRFALDKHRDELPFCNDIFENIPKPELLYLAGLLHDIAKGKGGDHSILGEKIAENFCQKHGLNEYETSLVCWLVKNHLLMSMTAQRKDIGDPEVINEFAKTVRSEEALDYLYLLTVADIRSTNSSLWNSWKDSLLKSLYTETRRALRRGLHNPIERQDEINIGQNRARNTLIRLGLDDLQIKKIWAEISANYFLRHSVEESIWHTLAIASWGDKQLPLVLLRPVSKRGGVEIFIYSRNSSDLFNITTATLDQIGLNILDARIMTTSSGFAINSFQVLEQSGEKIGDLSRELAISSLIRQKLLNPENSSLDVTRRTDRQIKHFTIPTEITFDLEPEGRYTVMELISTDRPGLLSTVGQVLGEQNIQLVNAKIATLGSRAEDLFYITDSENNPVTSPELQDKLKQQLKERLG